MSHSDNANDVQGLSPRAALLGAAPSLRAFALSLCGNADRADDLVQETLLRAWANIHSFEPGTNMHAWLFTILRNLFRSEYRKQRRIVEDPEDRYVGLLKSAPAQVAYLEIDDLHAALQRLPAEHREALVLVGVSGFTYDEVASICGCPVGTVKSRVHRARQSLAAMIGIESVDDLSPDGALRAVLNNHPN